jgi:hypothetical protein
MNTVDDITFFVKGKTVSSTGKEIKALPADERHKALMRLKALGSAVAGFASMEKPKAAAPAAAAGGAGRARSPSPKRSSAPHMPRHMYDDLAGSYETHEYKRGLGHPLKALTAQVDKLARQIRPASDKEYLSALKKHLTDVAIDASWDGASQKVVLLSDWESVFKKSK